MKESAQVNVYRFSELDGFEMKEATFLNKHFPKHFHTEWSLCRIDMGCENILLETKGFCLFANATILIPPFSVHSNWGNENSSWQYQSIYLNEDLVRYVAKKNNLDYDKLASASYYLQYNLPKISTQDSNYITQIENTLRSIFKNEVNQDNQLENNEILHYLNCNFKSKITLLDLERTFKVNKYKILRAFKAQTGISPQEYITALRMENAKKLFFKDKKIVNIALDSGFYDQSHFVHTFKRYFGITPFKYKSNCNILQD